jgi:alanine-glyoxylate transaminase/serine-glyoxylate transaminase/serine-pyruvate transaminase
MDMPVIDHRGPDFAKLGRAVIEGCQKVFRTEQPVFIFPSSGTGAWEAALVNTLSAGDRILMVETGHFAVLWKAVAERFGIRVDFVPGDWRQGADPSAVEERLAADKECKIRAVAIVHNETSTGATSRIAEIRAAIDRVGHPALFLVDTVSSLGSLDYRHDEWGVDVTVSGSQKGLMLPPGLGFTAVSRKALKAAETNTLPRSYWDWHEMLGPNREGFWPYTPATTILYGLREALDMLFDEGLEQVFARHQRHAEAARAAVRGWGLDILCRNPEEYSGVLTGVMMPEGYDADRFRAAVLAAFDMSLGTGLSKLKGKIFRIGHLGYFNDLTLMGTLAGVEMGLRLAGVPHKSEGVAAAMDVLSGKERKNTLAAA